MEISKVVIELFVNLQFRMTQQTRQSFSAILFIYTNSIMTAFKSVDDIIYLSSSYHVKLLVAANSTLQSLNMEKEISQTYVDV